jgi:hypothetical protein
MGGESAGDEFQLGMVGLDSDDKGAPFLHDPVELLKVVAD